MSKSRKELKPLLMLAQGSQAGRSAPVENGLLFAYAVIRAADSARPNGAA
jgi:hypothetical protein